MDEATLVGCRAKADRAYVRLEELAREWRAWLDTNPYPWWVDTETEPGWHCVYFDFSTPASPCFSVIVGEIAHDLRSALEHLAWREAVEFLGREPTKKEGREIAFPLARRSADFSTSSTRQYVSKDAWAIMERHQPYKRGKGRGPKALALLHWYNREDKHRTLQTVGVSAPPGIYVPHLRLRVLHPGATLLERQPRLPAGRRLKGRTEVVRLRFTPSSAEPQVTVEGTPVINPGFGKAPRPIGGFGIDESITEVRGVIDDFASLVP